MRKSQAQNRETITRQLWFMCVSDDGDSDQIFVEELFQTAVVVIQVGFVFFRGRAIPTYSDLRAITFCCSVFRSAMACKRSILSKICTTLACVIVLMHTLCLFFQSNTRGHDNAKAVLGLLEFCLSNCDEKNKHVLSKQLIRHASVLVKYLCLTKRKCRLFSINISGSAMLDGTENLHGCSG